jgi:hypothetical protein
MAAPRSWRSALPSRGPGRAALTATFSAPAGRRRTCATATARAGSRQSSRRSAALRAMPACASRSWAGRTPEGRGKGAGRRVLCFCKHFAASSLERVPGSNNVGLHCVVCRVSGVALRDDALVESANGLRVGWGAQVDGGLVGEPPGAAARSGALGAVPCAPLLGLVHTLTESLLSPPMLCKRECVGVCMLVPECAG